MTRTPEPLGEERGALPGALPIVRLEGAAGNLVSGSAAITVTASCGAPGETCVPAAAAAAAGGGFTNLTLAGTVQTPCTLTFSSGMLTPATSGAITVTVGALDHFAFSLTTSQTSGVAFTSTNTLTAQDASNNTVTTFDASANAVLISWDPALGGLVTGLGTLSLNVLDRSGDFVGGVADLTSKWSSRASSPAIPSRRPQ